MFSYSDDGEFFGDSLADDIAEEFAEFDSRGMPDDTLRVEYIDVREDRFNSLLGTMPVDMLPPSFVSEWYDYMGENADNFAS